MTEKPIPPINLPVCTDCKKVRFDATGHCTHCGQRETESVQFVPVNEHPQVGGEAAELKSKETDCGVCGVAETVMVVVCEGYAVPRCPAHVDARAYQAEARLHTLLSEHSLDSEVEQ